MGKVKYSELHQESILVGCFINMECVNLLISEAALGLDPILISKPHVWYLEG
jgi:hypothetical protein